MLGSVAFRMQTRHILPDDHIDAGGVGVHDVFCMDTCIYWISWPVHRQFAVIKLLLVTSLNH